MSARELRSKSWLNNLRDHEADTLKKFEVSVFRLLLFSDIGIITKVVTENSHDDPAYHVEGQMRTAWMMRYAVRGRHGGKKKRTDLLSEEKETESAVD